MNFEELNKLETDKLIAAEAAKEKDKLNVKKAAAQERFDRLDALRRNEDYKWFLDNYLIPMRDKEHNGALDVANSSEARNNHAQQHHRAKEMLSVLDAEHERLRAFIAQ